MGANPPNVGRASGPAILAGAVISAYPLLVGLEPFGPWSGWPGLAARVALAAITAVQFATALLLVAGRDYGRRGTGGPARLDRLGRAAAAASAAIWVLVAADAAAGRLFGTAPALPVPVLLAGPLLGLAGCLVALSAPAATAATAGVVGAAWILVSGLWPAAGAGPLLVELVRLVKDGSFAYPWTILWLLPWALGAIGAGIALAGSRLRTGRAVAFLALDVAFPAMLVFLGFWGSGDGPPQLGTAPPDPVLLTIPEAVAGVLVGCAFLSAGMIGRAPRPVRWGVAAVLANSPAWIVLVLYPWGQSRLTAPLLVAALALIGLVGAALGRVGPQRAAAS